MNIKRESFVNLRFYVNLSLRISKIRDRFQGEDKHL